MTLTHLALVCGAGGSGEVSAATVRDVLWAYVRAGDPVEHISVRAGPGLRLEIGVFTRPIGSGSPAVIACEIVERALRSSPVLDRWVFSEIRPNLFITAIRH